MDASLAALLLAVGSSAMSSPREAPPHVLGYRNGSLVTVGVSPAVAANPAALREVAHAACADLRPCVARIWIGHGQRFRTMSTAEVRSLVASYVITGAGAARFVCGPAGVARACSALAPRTGGGRPRPAI